MHINYLMDVNTKLLPDLRASW